MLPDCSFFPGHLSSERTPFDSEACSYLVFCLVRNYKFRPFLDGWLFLAMFSLLKPAENCSCLQGHQISIDGRQSIDEANFFGVESLHLACYTSDKPLQITLPIACYTGRKSLQILFKPRCLASNGRRCLLVATQMPTRKKKMTSLTEMH